MPDSRWYYNALHNLYFYRFVEKFGLGTQEAMQMLGSLHILKSLEDNQMSLTYNKYCSCQNSLRSLLHIYIMHDQKWYIIVDDLIYQFNNYNDLK